MLYLENTSAFRHQPSKSVLRLSDSLLPDFAWRQEPVVCGHRRLRYFNQAEGRELEVPISASPAVIGKLGVIGASDDGYVRFFDPELRKVYWERRLPASIYASIVVDPVRNAVILCTTSGLIFAFDLYGTLLWTRDIGVSILAMPAIRAEKNQLVVASFGHQLWGISLREGTIQYRLPLPAPWHAAIEGLASNRNVYASPALTQAGQAIVCSGEHVVCAGEHGNIVWQVDLRVDIKSSPIVIDRKGLVGIFPVNGEACFLELKDGTCRTRLALDAKVTASGALVGNWLAIGTVSGAVHGIDVDTCETAWVSHWGAPKEYTSTTVTPGGDFIATTSRGNVACLAAESGQFLWESSQVLGLPDHETMMDITPVISPHGFMYGGAYDGNLYQFSFRTIQEG